jgi:hypothetical protein
MQMRDAHTLFGLLRKLFSALWQFLCAGKMMRQAQDLCAPRINTIGERVSHFIWICRRNVSFKNSMPKNKDMEMETKQK